jgi:hypothetical protein
MLITNSSQPSSEHHFQHCAILYSVPLAQTQEICRSDLTYAKTRNTEQTAKIRVSAPQIRNSNKSGRVCVVHRSAAYVH